MYELLGLLSITYDSKLTLVWLILKVIGNNLSLKRVA